MRRIDITGQRFGKLVAVEKELGRWRCVCDCGGSSVVRASNLRTGSTKSCGCRTKATRTTHGLSRTGLFGVWEGMRRRCSKPKCKGWHRYGGRGISVCREWANDFVAFYDWAMANGYAHGLTIDRIDNDGNYEPRNCRWATRAVNTNNRSVTVMISAFGETKPLMSWVADRRCAVRRCTLRSRIRCGWDAETAMTRPAKKQ
jgi:hypothetical protein